MAPPLIAIIGSARTNAGYEPPMARAPEDAVLAAERIGRALADARFRIVVYSASEDFIEPAVVRGYLQSARKPARGSIQVRYDPSKGDPRFDHRAEQEDAFRRFPDSTGNWEVSFYESLSNVDAVLLVGGARSTLVAGVLALSRPIPLLTLAAFGGAAQRVWEMLPARGRLVLPDETALMREASWTPEMAAEAVGILGRQRGRLANLRGDAARHRHARVGLGCLFLVAAAWPVCYGLDGQRQWVTIAALEGAPMLAGALGALTRTLLDPVDADGPPPRPVGATFLLGAVAGLAAGVLFTTAQLAAVTSPDAGALLVQAQRVLPYALVAGLAGGLGFEAVLTNLRRRNDRVPTRRPSPSEAAEDDG